MEAETITLREGDVYRWRYRAPGDDGAWGRYHCCSCIGVVRRCRLFDTFWQIGGNFPQDARSFGESELYKLKLTFLGNLSDFNGVNEGEADYYADSDIMDLNHSNSTRGNFYLRKGAARSAEKMLDVARRRMADAKRDEDNARDRARRMQEAITRIEAGDTTGYL